MSQDKIVPPSEDKAAGGLGATLSTGQHMLREMGLLRGVRALTQANQQEGFDCPGCAWPDPKDRSSFEFCENGAKAISAEATRKRVDPAFFQRHSVDWLLQQSDFWLESQGRLTHPMVLRPGATHYAPLSWEEAFSLLADELGALESPDEAIFYTSGRTSNEAAFLYQLFARMLGTNNLPDCSNMCHESSGHGLGQTIGVGKGTVSLEDFERADAIFLVGQNPGTNHPRMLTTLQEASRRGCKIVTINPLRERALDRFIHPQEVWNYAGKGSPITSLLLQVKINGDVAVFKGMMKEIFAQEAQRPGQVLDHDFIQAHTVGLEALRASLDEVTWEQIEAQSGLSRALITEAAQIYIDAKASIICWAMGLTQHKNGVANIQEVVNLLLLRGNMGRPGAGACPVRGHSNVQGDRTVGIVERPGEAFLQRLGEAFGFDPPREHGFDVVAAIEAMHQGQAHVFVGMGGNFHSASPDTHYTAQALRRCRLTAQISTKLNRSHLVTGQQALILPCLSRTEVDQQASGEQFVTVENSMSVVHRSRGRFAPGSPHLRSEPAIVAGMAQAALPPERWAAWEGLVHDYDKIRDKIEAVIPGFEAYNQRVRTPEGFVLPNGARDRRFTTQDGKAHFTVHPLPRHELAPGQFLMMTLRSHDQYNTTIYGMDDRYRGIKNQRRVVLIHPEDIRALGMEPEQRVTLRSHFQGQERQVEDFTLLPYDIPRGCLGTYFPEANPLIPVQSKADISHTPTSKSVVVTVHSA